MPVALKPKERRHHIAWRVHVVFETYEVRHRSDFCDLVVAVTDGRDHPKGGGLRRWSRRIPTFSTGLTVEHWRAWDGRLPVR